MIICVVKRVGEGCKYCKGVNRTMVRVKTVIIWKGDYATMDGESPEAKKRLERKGMHASMGRGVERGMC